MQEVDRFVLSLFPANGPKIVDLKFFPGEDQVTVEIFCDEAHAAFLNASLEDGHEGFVENLNRVSVDRFINGA
jgi:hypothetical protein